MYRRALQKDAQVRRGVLPAGSDGSEAGRVWRRGAALRRAVELQPNNTDADHQAGQIYPDGGARRSASHSAQYVTEVQGIDRQALESGSRNPIDGHRPDGADGAAEGKDPAEAIKEFEKANAAKPNSPEVVIVYFQALVGQSAVSEAEKLARDLIAKQKTYAPIYDLLYVQYMRPQPIRRRRAAAETEDREQSAESELSARSWRSIII